MPNPENVEGHQFKPGQSGNPSGKPKGTKHLSTLLKAMLNETVEIDGQTIKFDQALIKKLLKKASEGDIKAIQEVFDRTEGKATQGIETEHTGGITIRFEEPAEYKRVYPSQDQGSVGDLDGDQ